MNKHFLLAIGLLLAGITTVAQQTMRPCCEIPSCREKAEQLAVKLTGLAAYAGPFKQSDNAANKESLDQLKKDHPDIYEEFIRTTVQVHRFINETRQGTCFMDALPEESFEDIYGWISYINDPQNPPKFPSAERHRAR